MQGSHNQGGCGIVATLRCLSVGCCGLEPALRGWVDFEKTIEGSGLRVLYCPKLRNSEVEILERCAAQAYCIVLPDDVPKAMDSMIIKATSKTL